jgi:hypothetical protein
MSRDQLSQKELAAALGKGLRTIERDVANGFRMIGRRATVAEWRAWKATQGDRRKKAA